MIRRRSWFEPSPWWPQAALTFTTTLTAALVTTAATGNDPQQDYAFPVLLAAFLAGTGALASGSRSNRSWQQLRDDFADEPDELLAAEQVVRSTRQPASPLQLLLAQRIADLRWREVGGLWVPYLLAATAAALVLMGGLGSRWWLVLAVTVGAAALAIYVLNRPLARRRAALASLVPA